MVATTSWRKPPAVRGPDCAGSAADTCASTDRPQVPAGGASYHLDVSIGGFASSASKQFILG